MNRRGRRGPETNFMANHRTQLQISAASRQKKIFERGKNRRGKNRVYVC
jgi:hypothetical protein